MTSRHDPYGLDTYEGQLGRGPWHQIGTSERFVNASGLYTIWRQKLHCRLGGSLHERVSGRCTHCGKGT